MPRVSRSLFLFSLFLFFCSTCVFAEEITITSYFPSPYGSYKSLNIYNQDDSGLQTDFTQAVNKAGLLITTDYVNLAYTPGIFWSTQNNNPTKPKAGIYLRETNAGTNMYLGTSNSYATGVTNDAIVIDESGEVGIGTITPAVKLDVKGIIMASDPGWQTLIPPRCIGLVPGYFFSAHPYPSLAVNSDNMDFTFGVNLDIRMRLTRYGDLSIMGAHAYKSGAGGWENLSDIRLKKNIVPLDGALDKILRLRGIKYQWKDPKEHADMRGVYMGMIAQDVEKVFPEWVGLYPESKYKTLSPIGFEALAVEAIRELKLEIDNLKTRLSCLEAKVK
jgi:hypothetical protein